MIKKRTLAIVMAVTLMFTGCSSNEKSKKSNKDNKNNTTTVAQTDASDKDSENTTKKEKEKEKESTEAATEKTQNKKADPVEMKAAVPTYSYTAAKTGSISEKYIYTHSGVAYKVVEDKTYRIYLSDGTLFPEDGVLSNNDYLGYGLFEMRKNSDTDVNTVALVTAEGEVLIPFEAASIDWVDGEDDTQHRFLNVIYATETTDSKENAFIYFTGRSFSFGPSEGDLLYKGYSKVYDLEKKQFIPNLKVTNTGYSVLEATKDGVLYADEEGNRTFYSADGKAIVTANKGNMSTDGTVVIVSDKDYNYTVYDGTGSVLLKTKDMVSAIGGQGGALTLYDSKSGSRVLVDYNGNKLCDKTIQTAYTISSGLVRISGDSGTSSLIHFDGSSIIENKKKLYDVLPGYFYYETDDGKNAIVTSEGEICPDCSSVYDLVAYNEEGNYFVWNTKEYSIKINKDTARKVSKGLVYAKNEEGKYGLYDLFTGNMILEGLYDDMRSDGSYVYAYNKSEEKWDIYKISTNVPYDK